jgi:hypothetical protein
MTFTQELSRRSTKPSVALNCPTCPARPRLARAKLVELAEQTLAAGRRDAYV